MNLLKSLKFSVTKRTLLFEAAVIWTFAGVMLLSRGSSMLEASSGFSWLKIVGCICGGLIFFVLVFLKISRKHVNRIINLHGDCLLYTSDAADEEDSVDLGGRRIIKKKNII